MGADGAAERYARQVVFAPIGEDGQAKLLRARVVVVGLGALGSVSASQLARAGVGYIRCVDRDIVEWTNLQRQTLYDEQDAHLGVAKAEAAAAKLRQFNSDIVVESSVTDLSSQNAEALLTDVDLIVDGTDNAQIRQLINDVAVKHGIAWAYGGAVSSYGVAGLIRPGETPCLACLFGAQAERDHDTCDTVGVIGPITGVIASLQVAEALKYLSGRTDALRDGLVYVDLWHNEWRNMRFGNPQPECPTCGKRSFAALDAPSDALTVTFCGRRTIQLRPQAQTQLSLEHLAKRLRPLGTVRQTDSLLRFERGEHILTVFADGRALVHGVDDVAQARSFYTRYVGM
ncbi:MAG: ThiF family adenylyltransferase [Firmicutes bacterium]|nr:ThiF family adenylyltransferase [Bacillota bacterium]